MMLPSFVPLLRGLRLSLRPALCGSRAGSGHAFIAPSVFDAYKEMVRKDQLLPNESQRNAAYVLQLLQNSLVAGPASHQPVARGGYMYGNVGSGKTLLLDLFMATTKNLQDFIRDGSSRQQEVTPEPLRSTVQYEQVKGNRPAPPPSTNQSCHEASHSHSRAPVVWRLHYHELMMYVHKRLHAKEQEKPKILTRSWNGRPVYRSAEQSSTDPFRSLAEEIGASTRVLAVDELHVTDQPDALLLTRLFTALPPHVILLFTSNQHPSSLYKKGPSRRYFQPFVDMLISSLVVLKLESNMDFRRLKSQRQQPDFKTASPSMRTAAAKLSQIKEAAARGVRPFADAVPGNDDDGVEGLAISGVASGQQLEGLWQACCAQAAWTGPEEVHVGYGRSIWLPRCALTHARPKGELASAGVCSSTDASTRRSVGQESMAYFTFDELLGRSGLRSGPHGSGMGGALSATDYMALCRRHDVIFIEGIPVFSLALRDEARRLVSFIDSAYETKSRLALSLTACVALDELFQPLLHAAYVQGMDPNQSTSSKQQLAQVVSTYESGAQAQDLKDVARGAIVLKQEEVLMYHRAASRLYEMCQ